MTTEKKVTQISQYLYKKVKGHRQRIGVMVADIDKDGYVKYGWSRVNLNSGDKFDPKVGLNLAIERLKAKETVPIPPSIFTDMYIFKRRCQRYFKDAKDSQNFPIQIKRIE